MKPATFLSALLCLALFTFTGCESTELKDGADDVLDVMRNGVDLITDGGNKVANAFTDDTEESAKP